jgi:hypothetical protein
MYAKPAYSNATTNLSSSRVDFLFFIFYKKEMRGRAARARQASYNKMRAVDPVLA